MIMIIVMLMMFIISGLWIVYSKRYLYTIDIMTREANAS